MHTNRAPLLVAADVRWPSDLNPHRAAHHQAAEGNGKLRHEPGLEDDLADGLAQHIQAHADKCKTQNHTEGLRRVCGARKLDLNHVLVSATTLIHPYMHAVLVAEAASERNTVLGSPVVVMSSRRSKSESLVLRAFLRVALLHNVEEDRR